MSVTVARLDVSWPSACNLTATQQIDGSNRVMRDAGARAHAPLRAPPARLRRRSSGPAPGQAAVESAARQAPDISHLIGFGILLSAALLIAIGALGASKASGDANRATEASPLA